MIKAVVVEAGRLINPEKPSDRGFQETGVYAIVFGMPFSQSSFDGFSEAISELGGETRLDDQGNISVHLGLELSEELSSCLVGEPKHMTFSVTVGHGDKDRWMKNHKFLP